MGTSFLKVPCVWDNDLPSYLYVTEYNGLLSMGNMVSLSPNSELLSWSLQQAFDSDLELTFEPAL